MEKSVTCALLMLLGMLLSTNSGSAAEKATILDEYLDAFVGVWQTTMVLEEDIAGQGKKGDSLPFVGTNRRTLKGNAAECSWECGPVRGKGLGVLDREEKCVRFLGADSTGMTLSLMYFKKDGQWNAKSAFTSPDGSKRTSSSVLTISDNGDTHTWRYTQRKKNDAVLPDQTEIWHRQKAK